MIQKIKNKIIEALGGYTAEEYTCRLNGLALRVNAVESELAHAEARNRRDVVMLRAKGEFARMYADALREDIKGEVLRQLAKGIEPYVKFDERPSAIHGLVECTAEVTVVKRGVYA